MALRATALGCTHIAASAWFTGEGTTRWGEPREQDKANVGRSMNATGMFQHGDVTTVEPSGALSTHSRYQSRTIG